MHLVIQKRSLMSSVIQKAFSDVLADRKMIASVLSDAKSGRVVQAHTKSARHCAQWFAKRLLMCSQIEKCSPMSSLMPKAVADMLGDTKITR
jgi:hypothetical protein